MDYRDFSEKPKDGQDGLVRQWWTLAEDKMPAAIEGIVRHIKEHQGATETQRQLSARLYGNSHVLGINGISFSRSASNQSVAKDRISYNVVASVIDTITAKIAKNRPKPLFLTSGGDYKVQRKAKKLNKFVEGIFYENDVRKLSPTIFRDGCVFGDGVVHVFAENKRVKFERVLASELYVDELEGFYGEPRQLHRVKAVDRRVLMQAFPKKAEAIRTAEGATADMVGWWQQVSDLVLVIESWHLPSGPKANDGKHVICIKETTLVEEEWTKDFFPFARFAWNRRLHGFWGQGLAEAIQNIQLEINKLLWLIQRSMHLGGTFKIALENGSKVVKEHLNNDIGSIITYTQNPPHYLVPPIVQPEIYSHLLTLKEAAYEQAGVSQLSAAAKKPDGLDSGKALREYNDIESDRFMVVGQAYENFHLDLAKLAIETAKDIYERSEPRSYEVKVPGKKFLETVDWKDIKLDDDAYSMQVYPISSLPQDPQGRLQTVQEYIQAGFLDPLQGRRLLDFPDLDAVDDMANAALDWIYEVLEKIVEDGDFTPPDPFMDLKTARTIAQQFYAWGQQQKLPEDRLELLRTFMTQIDALAASAMPPANDAMGGIAPPQAAPMPAPTSDLIPNAPAAMPAAA